LAEFQNPQQEPGMERRLLLVFALTFLVIVLFQPILKKYFPQATAPATAPAPQTHSQAQIAPQAATSNQVQPAQPAVPALNAGATKQATSETETIVENDLYRITFSNRGAQVKSWILKKFTDDKDQPLDLVNKIAADKYGYPLSLWTYDESQRNKLNSALYVTSSSGVLNAPGTITFEYADGEVAVRKSFSFDHTYVVRVETSVVSKGSPVAAYPAWPAGFGDEATLSSYAASQINYQYNGSTERLAIKKISGGNTLHMPFNWAGATDQYFAAVFIPDDSQNSALVTLRNSLNVPKNPKNPNPQDTAAVDTDVCRTQSADDLGISPRANRRRRGARSARLDQFRILGRDRAAAFHLAAVDRRLGPQLGMGDLHTNPDHQSGADAAAHLQYEVGVEDAENSAADEFDQGEIQEIRNA
jgi:YidC/Oxa1 family membrane protein insertase